MKPSNEKLSSENCSPKSNKNVEMVPPDGGWGWIIVIASIFITMFGALPYFAFSIIFSPILMQSGVSSVKISWIFNMYLIIYSLYTLFVGPLYEEFGHRNVALFGGVTVFVSVVLSGYAPSADFLFFSFGLIGGIGACSTLSLCFLIVPKYFSKRRGLALALTVLGSCGSSFLAPILTNYLLQQYGYKGTSLLFAAIVLNQCVAVMFFQPLEWHLKPAKITHATENKINEELIEHKNSDETQRKAVQRDSNEDASKFNASSDTTAKKDVFEKLIEEEKIFYKKNSISRAKDIFIRVVKSAYTNFKSLKYLRVKFIAIAGCGITLGYSNFQMWMPFIITDAGYSLENAAWCASISSIGSLIGRLVTSLLADRKFFNVRYGYMFASFLIGTCIIVFSFVKDMKLFIIVSLIWGFGAGLTIALMITVMIDAMGMKMLPAVFGVSQLANGFSVVVFGSITGAVRDATSSYRYSSWIMAGCSYLAFCLWLLMPLAEKIDQRKYRENEEENNA